MTHIHNRSFLVMSCVLFITQIGLLSLLIDAQTIAQTELSWLLSKMGHVVRWGLVSVFFFLFLLYIDSNKQPHEAPRTAKFSWLRLALNFSSYALFLPLTLTVFNPDESASSILAILWIVNAAIVFMSWCYFTWELKSLKAFIYSNLHKAIISASGAIVVLGLNVLAFDLWYYLSAIALYGSAILLRLLHNGIFIDPERNYLGLENFVVEISPICSGLEGMVISVCTVATYLYLVRDELKFPLAFILLPIAAVISVLFNIVRITLLVLMGEYVSIDLALEGFHSIAGWLAAIVITTLIIFVFSNWSFLRKPKIETDLSDAEFNDSALAWASLVPFILFLLTTLVLQMFDYEFDYLYGIKVAVAGIALIYFWRQYQFTKPSKWLEPILAGAIIAILWFFLSPIRPIADAQFADQLLSLSTLALLAWSLLRLAGSWVIIPIIEELIFRGYILARLSKQPFTTNSPIAFSWLALIVSSALFALIHQALIAGFVAGVIFALVRYRSHGITEVIIAHSAANIFVVAIAVATGQWSLL